MSRYQPKTPAYFGTSSNSSGSPKGLGSAELTAWHPHAGVGRLGLDLGVQVVLAPIALVNGWSTVGNASTDRRLYFLQTRIFEQRIPTLDELLNGKVRDERCGHSGNHENSLSTSPGRWKFL